MIKTLWKVELQNSHLGSHRPVYEPKDNSVYISDGWGAFYAAIRLHKLSLENGQETNSVLLRDTPNCLCFPKDQQTIIVALGKRIVEVDRKNLKVLNQWKVGVPQYCQYINMSEKTLLLMNWARPNLSLYDLNTSKAHKKKLGFCKGIFRIDESDFLVCTGKDGIVWRYSVDSGHLQKLLNTPQFNHARINNKKSKLILTLGNPHEITSDHVAQYNEFRKIRVYDLTDMSFKEFDTPTEYDYIEIDDDGVMYYFSRKTGIDICVEKDGQLEKIMSENLPDSSETVLIIPDCSMALSVVPSRKGYKSTLYGIKFDVR
ncbi:MAG: hypothetical protein QM730_17690 [Anaerolineales bacterium]